MKSVFVVSVVLAFGSQAFAEGSKFVHCAVKGKNPHSIVKVDAAEMNGLVVVNTSVRTEKGESILPSFQNKGTLNEFQVAADFYNGPFGIQQAYLVKTGEKYALESRTYCNGYYQEERCLDGDLIEKSSTSEVKCEN